ncbi:aminotransferase class I/II-fold pyridoxal phosphate-dependent enzyme [Aquabacterium parvum]|uniref:aminotransferase class I/II-fold pyridoxal phosphate-dependent enzyme n=1 Tax=Aquabacterium parvum TaxID=70584 RepID=UPI000718C48E|nr:aminotransferase class I/II-fold pyridoxal phosphate-dependent enzyme [Aquabacterium parvum]MBU0914924.1 aminotransferase class I/II-fold pyridoxal phosphate-dependent enzyme [Gammaproteobacteria bacterium]
MKVSQRAQAITPFLAMEFGKRAAELEAAGHRVIRLNLGEPDFGAPPAVRAELQRVAGEASLPYTGALGLPALREAIAGFYQQAHGLALPAERVVVTAGASAALLLVTAALVDPGDEVLVGDPSYPCNRQFLSGFGADVRLVPTDASSRFQLDLAAVQRHWSARTKGLMIATPSNPTGTSVPPAELAAICRWAQAHGAWRIVDEIYLNLSDVQADGTPAPTVLASDPGACVINSFSKYFGMTGWRLGWAVVPEALVPAMERLAQNYYICAPTPAQLAALACFTPESIAVCEARKREFSERRALVLQGLKDIGLPVPVQPDGAFYAYIDVSQTGLDAMGFCERALQQAHVALTPGNDFGVSGAGRFVRLSFAASRQDLVEGLARLGRFVASLRA